MIVSIHIEYGQKYEIALIFLNSWSTAAELKMKGSKNKNKYISDKIVEFYSSLKLHDNLPCTGKQMQFGAREQQRWQR